MKQFINFFIFIYAISSFAQQATPDFSGIMSLPNANFYDIQQAARNYYSLVEDNEEGGGFAKYLRWEIFWQNRVNKTGQTPGSFQYAFDALQSIYQDKVCNSSSIISSDWQLLGPIEDSPNQSNSCLISPNMGIITSVKTDPLNPDIIFAGSNSAGLWVTDISQIPITWSCLTESTRLPALGIFDIAIYRPDLFSNPIIYLATGDKSGSYGIGILKSIDYGATWEQIGPSGIPLAENVARKILIDPTNPDNIFALIGVKVFKTTDAGINWTDISPTLPNSVGNGPCAGGVISRVLVDIEMMPDDPNTLFVSTDDRQDAITAAFCPCLCYNPNYPYTVGNNGALVYRTNDGGNNWTEISLDVNGSRADWISLASTPADPNVIFVAYSSATAFSGCSSFTPPNCSGASYNGSFVKKIQRVNSSGTILTTVNPASNFGLSYYFHSFEISPTNAQIIYATTGSAGWGVRSTNGGSSFTPLPSINQHIDLRSIHIVDDNTIIFGNDGGVSMTTNGGANWSSVNGSGLSITQFYRMGSSEINSQLVAGGTQDNDVKIYSSGNWANPFICQDAAEMVFDINTPNILYAQKFCCSWNSQQIYKYSYSNNNWTNEGNIQPICPTDQDPNSRCPGLSLIPMQMPRNNYLYVGYAEIYKSPTPNIIWQKISDFSQFGVTSYIQNFDIASSNSNIIYLTHSGILSLFKTTTGGGLGLTDWQNLTQNIIDGVGYLPPMTDIVIHPENPDKIWIAVGGFGDNGTSGINNGAFRVIKSSDGGQTWVDYSKNLTQFPVNSIVCERGSDDGLYVGTDVGVFYTNNKIYPTDGWVCFSDALPVTVISDIEINYASNKIRAATFGRGIWESSLACPTDENLTLNNSTNFNNKFYEAKNDVSITASSGNISASNLKVRAGNEIIITATGTNEIIIGDNSHLFIHNCDQPGNSFRKAPPGENDKLIEIKKSNEEAESSDKLTTALFSSYPNPFSDHTHINYDIKEMGVVNISAYNICGKKVAYIINSKNHPQGQFSILFESGNIPVGIYYIVLQTEKENITQKAIKMK